jgi:predicted dehydrogenase
MMILVIGYGKMGQRHVEALKKLGYEYDLLDLDDDINDYKMSDYSHFIVASPNETHAQYYHYLKPYGKPILIEKPGVIKVEDLHILKDPLVSVGMSRRFHPLIREDFEHLLFEHVHNVTFIKRGPKVHDISEYLDLGIHSTDLACYLDVNADMYCKYSDKKMDLMVIEYIDFSTVTIDFINGLTIFPDCVFEMEEDDSIEQELKYFLEGGRIDAYEAHELTLKGENDNRRIREINSGEV